MPRGTPLAPDQKERLAAIYQATGNVAEAARQVEVAYAAAWEALHGERDDRRRYLHEKALERGERTGREYVAATQARIELLLHATVDTQLANKQPTEIEPSDLATLARAQGLLIGVISRVRMANAKHGVRLEDRDDARRREKLTRKRLRLEVGALEAEASKRGGGTRKVCTPDDPGWGDLQREVFGTARQGMNGVRPPTERDPSNVAPGDVSQISGAVDPRRR